MQTVADWMTPDPITIEENASIIEAIHLMKEKDIRRLPVTRNGAYCGLLTERMIMDYTPGKSTPLDTWEVHYVLSKAKVSDAMNSEPCTIGPEAPLFEAVKIMHDNKLNGICVTASNGSLVGVVTTINLMEALMALCSK
ncbi:CBS domain-containing protein [bacterium]|nr:CBS domain-containing protein [bacterium]